MGLFTSYLGGRAGAKRGVRAAQRNGGQQTPGCITVFVVIPLLIYAAVVVAGKIGWWMLPIGVGAAVAGTLMVLAQRRPPSRPESSTPLTPPASQETESTVDDGAEGPPTWMPEPEPTRTGELGAPVTPTRPRKHRIVDGHTDYGDHWYV